MPEDYSAHDIAKLKSRVTYIGGAINVFLTLLKIGFGLLWNSAALVADGVHSLADLVSDALVLVAIKLGAKEADPEHPYGHRRFETMVTAILALSLIIVAGYIAWDGIAHLLHPETLSIPDVKTMGIATISILGNEWSYHYTKRIADQTRSKLLLANAWHHRSDSMSSVVVLFAIGAVLLGYPIADVIAAIIVGLMIAQMGLKLFLECIRELVDTSLPAEFITEIRAEIKQTAGVCGIHLLRTRQMGEDAYIDAHIIVNSRISVSEGHAIGDAVRDNLIARFDDVVDVLVHIDAENDEYKHKIKPLSRQEVQGYLQRYLPGLHELVTDFRLHYLDNHIEIELIFSLEQISPEQIVQIKQQCLQITAEVANITQIFLFFKTEVK
jgi:cation diffusion facilitator family transporter